MRTSKIYFILLVISFFFISCKKDEDTLFKLLSSKETGVDFSNNIRETDSLNILVDEYIYNGGGVGVGDFNNDGLPDLFFSGNQESSRLYLNKGKLKFEDITEPSGIENFGRWCSGVAIVDINQDGLMDVYVGSTLKKDSLSRTNLLFVNQGLNQNKIPVFKEMAKDYGIPDIGYTTNSAFFDYDLDGDLDLYVLRNIVNEKIPGLFRDKINDGSALNNDHLYRNNGNNTFTEVTKESGILMEGYGLGINIADFNLDGYPDIYVSNDYMSNDLLYINNQNGTFTDQITDYIKHTCFSAMGTDVVDLNNDGFVDIVSLDMLPENNKRKKLMIKDNNYISYINNEQFKYQYQYVRNMLQLNQGFTPKGHPVFSEVGQLAGIYQTDWSWTPLCADFDNDGLRDIIVTNGFPRDVTDRDFIVYRGGPAGAVASNMFLVDSIPQVKIPNYAFRNTGNVVFENTTKDWGLNIPSFSNGAVYSDLDNDGDLDVVVNNINDKAFVFKNQLHDRDAEKRNNFLRVAFKGNKPNLNGIGAKLFIYYGKEKQYYEHSPYRGYLSSVEDIAHFGLGSNSKVDSLVVYWLDGSYQKIENIKINSVLTLKQAEANQKKKYSPVKVQNVLFQEISSKSGIKYKHAEADKIDFNLQRTMPHKFTQAGPGVSVGDIDNNGLDDFFIGGAADKKGVFFIQSSNGTFTADSNRILSKNHKTEEDLGVLFFDADNDTDLDLYIESGSYEFEPGSPFLKDRLYKNDGKGFYSLDSTALPDLRISGSCVRAADFDKDGDLDLFIGGKIVPGEYPKPAKSAILLNNGGKFTDVSARLYPKLDSLGLVNDAIWTDFDNDNNLDLIIAGEWMPVTFLKNLNGKFTDVTSQTGIGNKVGWWNSLAAADFDKDGDIDYVAGNLGLNTNYTASDERPLSVYAKDFDKNGRYKTIMVCYMKDENGELQPFPMHTRDDLFIQMPVMKKKFSTYNKYALAPINEVLTEEERKDALILNANYFSSSYIENLGGGKFKISALPIEAQYAPLFGMTAADYDKDGFTDLLITGNDYSTEVFTGRYDAMIGLMLKGDGKGGFRPLKVSETGFFVDGDAKGLAEFYNSNNEKRIIAVQNRDSVRVFSNVVSSAKTNKVINLQPNDLWAEITNRDGKKYRKEFYYGSAYLSQSSRKIEIDDQVASIKIFDFSGKSRIVKF
jgi:enediyne biosynthesis protein E4